MNKRLLIVGIAVLLICIGLSGCNENVTSSSIELVSYNVTTKWESKGYYDDNWEYVPREVYYCDGFCHNITEDIPHYDRETTRFEVTGTIKNIADKKLDSISIDVNFYDSDWNLLCTDSTYISDLPSSYSKNFTAYVLKYGSLLVEACEYYDNIENVDFDFSVS